MLEPVTYTAPAHWACALINGDDSGLEESDAQAAQAWAESLPGPIVSCGDESPDPWFSWHHDAQAFTGRLGCTVTDYTVLTERGAEE